MCGCGCWCRESVKISRKGYPCRELLSVISYLGNRVVYCCASDLAVDLGKIMRALAIIKQFWSLALIYVNTLLYCYIYILCTCTCTCMYMYSLHVHVCTLYVHWYFEHNIGLVELNCVYLPLPLSFSFHHLSFFLL